MNDEMLINSQLVFEQINAIFYQKCEKTEDCMALLGGVIQMTALCIASLADCPKTIEDMVQLSKDNLLKSANDFYEMRP